MQKQVEGITAQYRSMVAGEELLVGALGQRLEQVKQASLAIAQLKSQEILKADQGRDALMRYFETKLNRMLLDYMLHANLFQAAEMFTKETGLQAFSDQSCYLEMASVLNALNQVIANEDRNDYTLNDEPESNELKSKALATALNWCTTYRSRLTG